MEAFVKYTGYSTVRNGVSSHFVTIIADTAADIPEPQDNWETGSELIVVENGGKKYILNNARTWVEVPNFTSAANSTPQNVEWVEEIPSETFSGFIQNPPSSSYNLSNFIESIRIPDGVTILGNGCFAGYYPSLASVSIPNTVTTLEGGVFNGCTALTEVTLPGSVRTIGGGCFMGSGVKSIYFEDGFEALASGTFSSTASLETVRLPETLISIGGGAFASCTALAEITIPSSVQTISDGAFAGCTALTEININKPENSIEGAPWGAPETCKINWKG